MSHNNTAANDDDAEPTAESVSIPTITLTTTSNIKPNGGTGILPPPTTAVASSETEDESVVVTIRLDADEEQLFEILREVAATYNHQNNTTNTTTHTPPLEIRVAGGWVRDKILGLSTHDVDVAVNCLTGVQFAELVQEYVQQQKNSQTVCGRMGVIAANPAQSKHLETATMRVAGLEVDFCNLRANEVYQDHSRIPETQFGTAADDAMRRDFTCNALFYNLLTLHVEDWTGRGLHDLRAGVLVTPLDPHTTFTDDPLRVLRAIRFAVRYHFNLSPEIQQAAVHPAIHTALHIKVSRERVGKELEAMLSGKGAKPVTALETIAQLKLAGSVFCVPICGIQCADITGTIAGTPYSGAMDTDSDEARHIRELGWEESRHLLALLPTVLEAHATVAATVTTTRTVVDSRLLPVAVFLLPFRTLLWTEIPKSRNSNAMTKRWSAVTFMIREGIKFKKTDEQAVTTVTDMVDRMAEFLTKTANNIPIDRLESGLLLREAKELWVTALLLATVLQIRQQQQQDSTVVDWIQVGNVAYAAILNLNLDRCWKMRPLLDGKDVIQALDLPRGPAVGIYMEEQMRWMMQHPTGTRDECIQHLQLVLQLRRKRDSETEAASVVGISDGTGPSSPVSAGKTPVALHFSKKMHVESMDLSR